MIYNNLNPEKALVWRITHRRNLPWVFANGLHAGSGGANCADWKVIGNRELITRRGTRQVPLSPGGVLNDYVPFYFTPFSPMMYNIRTGRGGVRRLNNADIVILVSSLFRLRELGLLFMFTDGHAYPVTANYFNDLTKLNAVDWSLLQRRDFRRDPDDPRKVERYQAEALVHKHVPVHALLGVVCYTEQVREELQEETTRLGLPLAVYCRPQWYF